MYSPIIFLSSRGFSLSHWAIWLSSVGLRRRPFSCKNWIPFFGFWLNCSVPAINNWGRQQNHERIARYSSKCRENRRVLPFSWCEFPSALENQENMWRIVGAFAGISSQLWQHNTINYKYKTEAESNIRPWPASPSAWSCWLDLILSVICSPEVRGHAGVLSTCGRPLVILCLCSRERGETASKDTGKRLYLQFTLKVIKATVNVHSYLIWVLLQLQCRHHLWLDVFPLHLVALAARDERHRWPPWPGSGLRYCQWL